MSKCAQQTASLTSIARGFGIDLSAVVHSDATAALGIAYRRGLGGKTRRVKVHYLWIQDAVENKELEIGKVGTLENPADLLTKFLANDALSKHAQRLSLEGAARTRRSRLWPYCRVLKQSEHVAIAKTLAATLAPFSLRT